VSTDDFEHSVLAQHISFPLNGMQAAGTLHLPDRTPLGSVVFFHGRGGSRRRHQPAAAAVAQMGLACMTFDFRGCGETGGDPAQFTLGDWLADSVAGFDFLAERDDCPDPYGCYGSSFGAYLAARVAHERPVSSLVLRVPSAYPPTYLDAPQTDVDENRDDIWVYRSTPGVSDDPAVCGMLTFRGDVLIVGAGQDDEVPSETIEAYLRASSRARSARLVWLPSATHNMNEEPSKTEYIKLMSEWFGTTLTSVVD
jgi:alpha-beta hydrolase superfamily lysophospholipase